MDYDKFKKEMEEYDDWERTNVTRPRVVGKRVPSKPSEKFLRSEKGGYALTSAWMNYGHLPRLDDWTGQEDDDRVNSPSHYTRGKQEVIDTIEEAVQDAPTPGKGLLQGQVLKYMLRVWLKDNPLEDLKKAQWYLERLINKMEKEQ